MEQHKNVVAARRGARGGRCIARAGNTAVRVSPPSTSEMTVSQHMETLAMARRQFLVGGAVPAGIPQPILRSWQRSATHGLDVEAKVPVESVSGQAMREALERNEALIQAALGEVEALRGEIESPGGIVVLADPQGFVLSRVGSTSFVGEADELALRPGVQWDEASVGTNAIGTALVERSEMSVFGGEHFLKSHGVLSCSAVPIIDPFGGIIGVLDLSTASSVPHHYALALLRRAAELIERRLFEQMLGRQEQVHFHSNPYLLGGPHEGMLAFEGDRLVGANRHAIDLLGLTWSAVGVAHFDQLFSAQSDSVRRNAAAEQCMVQSTRGGVLFARLRHAAKAPSGPAATGGSAKAAAGDGMAAHRPRTPPRKSELLPHEILDRLLNGSAGEQYTIRKAKAGQLIYGSEEAAGDGESILVVRSGRLRCYSSYDGKELTLFFLEAGDSIALHPQTMLEAKHESELIVLHRSAFRRLAQDEPELGLSVMPAMERMLQKSIRMIEDMAFHSVRHRLIRLLCEMADRDGQQTARGVLIDKVPHAGDLAMQVGSTRQTVSTMMAELVRGGLLQRVGNSSIIVPNVERLAEELEAL